MLFTRFLSAFQNITLLQIQSMVAFLTDVQHCKTFLHSIMAQYLFPLSPVQIRAYFDVDSLVDVAVQTSDGTTNIVTFDPRLLPSHLRDGFLAQLFQWAKVENVLPMSSHGTWEGASPGTKTLMLLPLYYAWLEDDAHEQNVLE